MRVLLTGACGWFGPYIHRHLLQKSYEVAAWSLSGRGCVTGLPSQAVDLRNHSNVLDAFRKIKPNVVIHAAATSKVAECQGDPDAAMSVNVAATRNLAELTAENNARFVFVSTDLLFDGKKGMYVEDDEPNATMTYGKSKALAEKQVREFDNFAIIRMSLLYGPHLLNRPCFFDQQVTQLRAGQTTRLFVDEWRTPLDLTTGASALISVAESEFVGTLHIGGPERMNRYEFGTALVAQLGCHATIEKISRLDIPNGCERPEDTSLDSSRWRNLFPEHVWPSIAEVLALVT